MSYLATLGTPARSPSTWGPTTILGDTMPGTMGSMGSDHDQVGGEPTEGAWSTWGPTTILGDTMGVGLLTWVSMVWWQQGMPGTMGSMGSHHNQVGGEPTKGACFGLGRFEILRSPRLRLLQRLA